VVASWPPEWLSGWGIETKMVQGRRITDAETLKLVTMVYAGWINKNMVALLQKLGVTLSASPVRMATPYRQCDAHRYRSIMDLWAIPIQIK